MTSNLPLWIISIELVILAGASSVLVSVALAFVVGFSLSLVLVFLLFYLGLDSVDRYFEKKKSIFVEDNKRGWNSSQLAGAPAQLQSEIMLLVRPQNKERVTTWYKASLKNNFLQFQESKPLLPEEPRKGTILTDDLKVTVVRTKKGGLWKKTNYLEISHESRLLLGEAKNLYLFFRTRREMEEWYHALVQSAKYHSNQSENPALASFRILNSKFNPGLTAPAVEAPWFNALAQRIFYQYSSDPLLLEVIKNKINKQFDKIAKPDVIKALDVLEVKLDTSLPIFENFQLLQVTQAGSVKLATDVKYGGGFYMKINVIIETPKILDWVDSKILPAVLSARIRGLTGKLVLHLAAPPSDRIWIGFDGEPEIDLKVETEIDLGMENKAFSISNQFPKLSKIIRTILRREIVETTLLPEMEDIPLPKVGKDAAREELGLDVPVSQRWESDEVRRKAEEASRKVEERQKESKLAKEKAGFLHEHAVKEASAVKEAVVSHVAALPSVEVASPKKSIRQKLFGSDKDSEAAEKPLEPQSILEPKEELTFGEALNNIDDALTSFLGSIAGNSDGNKTKAELVSDAASAAAQDVKNKVSSLLFGDQGARPSSPVKDLDSLEKKRRSSGSTVSSSSTRNAPTASPSPPPRSSFFVPIPTQVVLPSIPSAPIASSPPKPILPVVEEVVPVPDSAELGSAPTPVVKEIDDIFGTSPGKASLAPPPLPTFEESVAPSLEETLQPSQAPASAPAASSPEPSLSTSVLGMSTLRVIEDYSPPSEEPTPPHQVRDSVLSRPADEDDFGYVSSSDDELSSSPKPAALLFSPPRKVSKTASTSSSAPSDSYLSEVKLEAVAAPVVPSRPVKDPGSQTTVASLPSPSTSQASAAASVEDDIFGSPSPSPAVPPPRPATSHPGLTPSLSRPANQWSATAGEKPLPQVPSSKPAEKKSRNPFKGFFGGSTTSSQEDSTLDSFKSSIIGLGDRVGAEHTGIASLDSALDSVFGSISSKAKELSESSPRKKK